MTPQEYFVHYKYSNGKGRAPGEAKEGPYDMDKALARKLDLGGNAWIEVRDVRNY